MWWLLGHEPVLLCMAVSLLTIPGVSGLVNIASAARQGQCVDLTSTEPYMYVNKVSLIGCAEACIKSDLCTALEYQRLANLCRLFDGAITPTQCRGRALLLRADIMATPTDVCGASGCPKIDCGPVPAITDMTVLGNQIKLGSVVKYTCTWTGDVTYVTCLNSGVWSTLPSCTQPACGSAPTVTDGSCSLLPSDNAQCTCNAGHSIDPYSHTGIVTCNLGTSAWDPWGFTCEKDCGTPSSLTNGQYTPASTYPPARVGNQLQYSCDANYKLEPYSAGPVVIECDVTGNWEALTVNCEQDCVGVPALVNADCTNNGDGTAGCDCQTGYSYSDTAMTMPLLIVCTTGAWDLPAGICLIECGIPPILTNGYFDVAFYTPPERQGDSVMYKCNSGFAFSNNMQAVGIFCEASGNWGPMTHVVCYADCGTPPTLTNGRSTLSSTGDVVTYQCKNGYAFANSVSGTLTLTCPADGSGTWPSLTDSCDATASSSKIGASCSSVEDCSDANANCWKVRHAEYRCFCGVYTSYNSVSKTCESGCTLSPTFADMEETENYSIEEFDLTTTDPKKSSLEACWNWCITKQAQSADWGKNNEKCRCNYVTKQQVLDSSPSSFVFTNNVINISKVCVQ